MILRRWLPGLAMLAATSAGAQVADLAGDWDGMLKIRAGLELPLILHLADAGSTLESPEQSRTAMPVAVTRDGTTITVAMTSPQARFTGAIAADGGAMEGRFMQGSVVLPVRFVRRAPGAAPPGADRPQTPKPPFPYTSADIRFPSGDGTELAGTLTRPAGDAPVPAVVLVAGSGPQNRDVVVAGHRSFRLLADRLSRAGIAVLRYDKRGVGASGGSFASATAREFTADAAAAARWLAKQPGIDPRRIGFVGHSEGGEIAPAAAAEGGVAFLVLLAPPGMTGGDVLVSQKQAIERAMGAGPAVVDQSLAIERQMLDAVRATPDPAALHAKVLALYKARGVPDQQAEMLAGEASSVPFRALVLYDPIPALRTLHQPVLVVQGGRDLQVVPADNLPPIRAALAGNDQARIVELPGLNHLLQPAATGTPEEYRAIPTTIDEAALALIVDWVRATTGLKGQGQ